MDVDVAPRITSAASADRSASEADWPTRPSRSYHRRMQVDPCGRLSADRPTAQSLTPSPAVPAHGSNARTDAGRQGWIWCSVEPVKRLLSSLARAWKIIRAEPARECPTVEASVLVSPGPARGCASARRRLAERNLRRGVAGRTAPPKQRSTPPTCRARLRTDTLLLRSDEVRAARLCGFDDDLRFHRDHRLRRPRGSRFRPGKRA